MDIPDIIKVKMPWASPHPDGLKLGIPIIDPFHDLSIADLAQSSLGS
jgi:hypothetical protein